MSLKIRLARGGSKHRPYYNVVIADSRFARDGRFIEKIGAYNPLLGKDDAKRFVVDLEKAKEWLKKGATPTDRVARFLAARSAPSRARKPRNAPRSVLTARKLAARLQKKPRTLRLKKPPPSNRRGGDRPRGSCWGRGVHPCPQRRLDAGRWRYVRTGLSRDRSLGAPHTCC